MNWGERMSVPPDQPPAPSPGPWGQVQQPQGQGSGQGPGQYQQAYAQPQPGGYPAAQYHGYPQAGYPQAGYPQAGYPQAAVAPKNPAISLLLSFFIPGLGSMVNGRVNVGVIILVSYIVGLALTLFIIGIFIAFGVWIWGMIDAYQSAVAWNRAHGIVS